MRPPISVRRPAFRIVPPFPLEGNTESKSNQSFQWRISSNFEYKPGLLFLKYTIDIKAKQPLFKS